MYLLHVLTRYYIYTFHLLKTPSDTSEWAAFLLHSREVSASNPGPVIVYHERFLVVFLSPSRQMPDYEEFCLLGYNVM
jgi:hypothetical protein